MGLTSNLYSKYVFYLTPGSPGPGWPPGAWDRFWWIGPSRARWFFSYNFFFDLIWALFWSFGIGSSGRSGAWWSFEGRLGICGFIWVKGVLFDKKFAIVAYWHFFFLREKCKTFFAFKPPNGLWISKTGAGRISGRETIRKLFSILKS